MLKKELVNLPMPLGSSLTNLEGIVVKRKSLKESATLDPSKQMPSSIVNPIDEAADLVFLDGIPKGFNICHNFLGQSLLVAI